MNWKQAFTSSIGKKLVMSLTGIFLITFLIVHCYINAQIFWMDGGVKFTEAGHFMATNPVIRFVEIGLFVLLFLHIIQGLMLWSQNKSKRNTRYAVSAGNHTSKWYSRSMGLLGTLILLFLCMHLYHFWIPNRYQQTFGSGEIDLFGKMQAVFSNPAVVVVYVLGCIALGYHLVHGFYSAFQTLGLGTHRYKKMIRNIGIAFSIIVPLIFALMPIGFMANLIH
ncbi:succinate dehydrogenase cytochrome b subunit [Taibaiella soli]|uniref:Succinate dehydrogenase n=1 Tax=Taibaiella soli TaxID=1649169 RepID=A0A2W2BL82_9BACT|nr:succinate dehydrogenase cytochrome b subunit [Taibaiella soli]PZF74186.1 succinate dehydrogenase [Taibaiella soli]